jgi:hypothetical protein
LISQFGFAQPSLAQEVTIGEGDHSNNVQIDQQSRIVITKKTRFNLNTEEDQD